MLAVSSLRELMTALYLLMIRLVHRIRRFYWRTRSWQDQSHLLRACP
jgi:hypothetical protein